MWDPFERFLKGVAIASLHSEGIIKKKYFLLSLGWFLFTISTIFESSFNLVIIVLFARIGISVSLMILYLGLREEPEKRKEAKTKKDVIIEESLFRISKRPDVITEEEVSVSKERKICLVCKGKLARYNIYICPDCDTFYCEKCAQALETMENACWVCNTPFDKSKPSKPFKKEEEEGVVTIEENDQKAVKPKK